MKNGFHSLLKVALGAGIASVLVSGCKKSPSAGAAAQRVVVYTSVDEEYAKPILNDLARKTGLQIDALYDVEAAKTAGLVSRIRAENSRPHCDIFWSSAIAQTVMLQRDGLLQPYQSPAANDIPARFRDKTHDWTVMGLRVHTLGYRKGMNNPPQSLDDLQQPRFHGHIGISNPLYGSGNDFAAALGARRGVPATLKLYKALMANGLRVMPGNSVVADGVGGGELLAGTADTDDWETQKAQTGKVAWQLNENSLVLPGTAALIKGAPHEAAARKLFDALVSADTEARLTREMPGVYTCRLNAKTTKAVVLPPPMRPYVRDDYAAWATAWNKLRDPLAKILLNN